MLYCEFIDSMKNDNGLTQKELKTLLDYNPETGVFTWRVDTRRTKTGDIAGYGSKRNVVICINGVDRTSHRLAFLYMTGNFPEHEVDHINRNPLDNRWCNLREADRSKNNANRKSSNKCGYKGVKFYGNGFYAQIRINGKVQYLGSKPSAYEASLLYNEAAAKQFGEFACTGSVEQIADGKKTVDASVESEIQAVRIEQNHL